jgi:hypothetical protein
MALTSPYAPLLSTVRSGLSPPGTPPTCRGIAIGRPLPNVADLAILYATLVSAALSPCSSSPSRSAQLLGAYCQRSLNDDCPDGSGLKIQ